MPKAKKLPSGSWRCRVYSGTDSRGQKHYESFTAGTKAEAEMMAAQFYNERKRRLKNDLTVAEALEGYITAKEAVLSPSTIRGYRQMQKNRYGRIKNVRIRKLTSAELQNFISETARESSAKTTANIYGLLSAALAFFDPDATFRVTLPQKPKKIRESPSDEDVRRLFEAAAPQMKLCIALAALSIRRGEMCALRYRDIKNGVAYIHADLVRGPELRWVYKDMPKTADSVRLVSLSQTALDLLGEGKPDDFILTWRPDTITKNFIALRNSLGLSIRFHDLRCYFASVGTVIGIPDMYLENLGGWHQGGSVMKEIYQNKITSLTDVYASKIAGHQDEILMYDSRYAIENEKAAD